MVDVIAKFVPSARGPQRRPERQPGPANRLNFLWAQGPALGEIGAFLTAFLAGNMAGD